MTVQPQITTPENLGVLLDQKAKQSPSAAALNFIEKEQTITYEELRQIVNRTANAYHDLVDITSLVVVGWGILSDNDKLMRITI